MIPVKYLTSLGLSSALLMAANSSVLAQVNPEQPNVKMNVERVSGSCPTSVGIWTILLPLEGGADHIVVADTNRIAGAAKISKSSQKLLEYQATLSQKFASCVGKASSPKYSVYSFVFQNGQVTFRVNLGQGNVNKKVVSQQLATGRPYVYWQARE
jgi:hypothetical protein